MFQLFTETASPTHGLARVTALKAELAAHDLDGFLIPRADAHQGEYVAEKDERLAWLTGFTGSAGQAIVTREQAVIFVDGRYTLQVRTQTDGAVFTYKNIPADQPSDWLAEHLPSDATLGFDPWLHTHKEIEGLEKALAKNGVTLASSVNLVDAIWEDQPLPPKGKIFVQPLDLAGKPHAEKLAELAAELVQTGVKAAILTLPDSIAWLLNIRGADVPKAPLPLCFAILHSDATLDLFIDPDKVDADVANHLGPDVRCAPLDAFVAAIEGLVGAVGVDAASAPYRVFELLDSKNIEIKWMRDPCRLPKACKNPAELSGTRAAHLRDAAAMAEFLCWLDDEAPSGALTEIAVARQLEAFRQKSNALRDISFDTISGAGPNGAIVHYRVTEATDRAVSTGELLLVDSGGQYQDGTTDITRTIAVGTPPEGAARAFTLVLKGMIGISMAKFPEGLAGRDIDALARIALWQAGLDYDHGTGHGVGAYLSVHEGPQNLSRRGVEPLRPGMIISNEPGYYREGAFGIRIENLVVVNPPAIPEGGERPMLSFETLTLAPIDQNLIDRSLLTEAETAWINSYHSRVAKEVMPHVSTRTADWLKAATKPL